LTSFQGDIMATLAIQEPIAKQSWNEGALTSLLAWLLPWIFLAGYLALVLPLFVCEGLHSDIAMWDLNTRTVLRGGVLYRDTAENNFPGMLWPLLAVRSTLGWSSEALYLVDFGIVSAIAWLLTNWLPPARSPYSRVGALFILYAFYLSTSEWCHCQRDTWMLLPSVAALSLRIRQTERLRDPHAPKTVLLGWAALEGILWAMGFWIKPFVAVPCLTCWVLSVWVTDRTGRRWDLILVDGAGFLAGGIVAGALGIGWMVYTGTWPWFCEMMFDWNREYVVYDMKDGLGWMFVAGFVARFFPWVFIHAAAIPIAVRQIWRLRNGAATDSGRISSGILAGFYLAWLFQALVLQHSFDYVHAPAILLGLVVVVELCLELKGGFARFSLAAFVFVAIGVNYPTVYGHRLGAWSQCIREGSTPQLRDHVALIPTMNWSALEEVRSFLATQDVHDGELTCFSMRTTPLYLQLNLQPSTRHIFLQNALTVFVRHRSHIQANLADSRQRLVVFDLFGMRLQPGETEESDPETRPLPTMWQTPSRWADKVVFRSGRYVVFAIGATDMTDWLEECFQL
jgi:hypothetical protein